MSFCCGSEVKWKREHIQDHSFDYVDSKDFYNPSYWLKIKYIFIFILVIKSVLIYVSDLWTAYNLAFNSKESDQLYFQGKGSLAYYIIFYVSIGMSFLLLIYEARKSWIIFGSRDISFTYTNVIAHRIYVLGSYSNFCFFERIGTSKNFSDFICFYVFFTLKGWKRILFAHAPREVIKLIILVSLFSNNYKLNKGFIDNLRDIFDPKDTPIMLKLSLAILVLTNLIFIFSILQVIFSMLAYIPLLFKIQGNLKEYCCHKVDKRISKLLAKNARRRKLGIGFKDNEYGLGQTNYKNFKSNDFSSDVIKPTLPKIDLDDDAGSIHSSKSASSTTTLTGGRKNNLRSLSPTGNSSTAYSQSSRTCTPTSDIHRSKPSHDSVFDITNNQYNLPFGNLPRHQTNPSGSSHVYPNSRFGARSPNHNPSSSSASNSSANFRPPPSAFTKHSNNPKPPY